MAFSGVIPVLRALEDGARTEARLAAALTLPPGKTRARLLALRDIFGAVEQNEAGEWRTTFRPQWLNKNFLASALPDLQVHIRGETPGTNALARRAKTRAAFFAEHQTRGRGRFGRRWLAMPGGCIAMSVRLPAPPTLAGFSLAVGTALWRALGGAQNGLRLKWPNDLLNARGEKIGGVLIDAAGGDVVAGAGINLLMTPQLRAQIARPVAAHDSPLPRNECAALACRAVCDARAAFAREGLAAFLPSARAAHFARDGEDISFHCGDEEVRGAFAGFAEDGALLIRRRGGVRAFISGEIHVAGG